MIWSPGYVNSEMQAYVDRTDNIRQEGGSLVIQGKNDWYNGYEYTSGRIETYASWTYGRIEARIQLPTFQGSWPAFWMLGSNIGSYGWPGCGELDIMEHVNTNSTIVGSIHWDNGGYSLYNGTTTTNVGGWHVYAVEWDSSSIRWYVDSNNYLTANIAGNINSTEEFHRPFYIILNLAIGGNWPGFSIDWPCWPLNTKKKTPRKTSIFRSVPIDSKKQWGFSRLPFIHKLFPFIKYPCCSKVTACPAPEYPTAQWPAPRGYC